MTLDAFRSVTGALTDCCQAVRVTGHPGVLLPADRSQFTEMAVRTLFTPVDHECFPSSKEAGTRGPKRSFVR
jgi:hypothetical protein